MLVKAGTDLSEERVLKVLKTQLGRVAFATQQQESTIGRQRSAKSAGPKPFGATATLGTPPALATDEGDNPLMNNASKRSEGAAEKLGGKIKRGIGKLIDNEQMQAEGAAKEAKGRTKEETAKAAERGKGKVEEVTGAVKNRVGAVIDNEQMQAEGKLCEVKGQARQKANR